MSFIAYPPLHIPESAPIGYKNKEVSKCPISPILAEIKKNPVNTYMYDFVCTVLLHYMEYCINSILFCHYV